MKSVNQFCRVCVAWAGALGLAGSTSLPSHAQVIGALGSSVSTVSGAGCPGQCTTVTGGIADGENLFHSFLQFDVQTGEQVMFEHDSSIEQIFGRISGAGASDIDGLLTTQGASLYLLNPNGFIFRGNAQINIADTFAVSTADRFIATGAGASGGFFPADLGQTPDYFSVSPGNLQLQFPDSNNNAKIELLGNNGSTSILNPSPGRALALLAGNIEIDDYTLYVPENQLVIGGFKREGSVSIRSNLISLSVAPDGDLTTVADVSLTNSQLIPNGSLVDGAIPAGTVINGEVRIRAFSLNLLNSKVNTLAIPTELKDGRIRLSLRGASLSMSNSELITRSESGGSAGDIQIIDADRILLDNSQWRTFTDQSGGRVIAASPVFAREIQLVNGSEIATSIGEQAQRDAGLIDLSIQDLSLSNSRIQTVSGANILGGDRAAINLSAANRISLLNRSEIAVKTTTLGSDNRSAGNLTIEAPQLSLDASSLSSTTQANGGNISLSGTDFSLAMSSEIRTFSASTGGDIDINLSGDLSHLSESSIQADASQPGGGIITIQANALTSLPNSNADILFTGLLEPSRLSINADFDEAVFAPLDLAANGEARTNRLNQFYYLVPESPVVIPPVVPPPLVPPSVPPLVPTDNGGDSDDGFSMPDVPPWLTLMFGSLSEESELSLALSRQGQEIATVQGCGRRDASVSGLRVSDRGGIAAPPSGLLITKTLGDLGRGPAAVIPRSEVSEFTVTSSSNTGLEEATAWKRDRQGRIALVQSRSFRHDTSIACGSSPHG